MRRPKRKHNFSPRKIFRFDTLNQENVEQVILVGVGALAHVKTTLNDFIPTSLISLPLIDFMNLTKKKMFKVLSSYIDKSKSVVVIFDSIESLLNNSTCVHPKRMSRNGFGAFLHNCFKKKTSYVLRKLKQSIVNGKAFKAILWRTHQPIYCCSAHGLIRNPYTNYLLDLEKNVFDFFSTPQFSVKNLHIALNRLIHGDTLIHRYQLYQSYNLGAKKPALRMPIETFHLKMENFEQRLKSQEDFIFYKAAKFKDKSSRFFLHSDVEMFDRFSTMHENTGFAELN